MMKRFNYGGQAVIEGVMMRGQRVVVTAVRRPGGGIALDTQPLPAILTSRARRVPLIRGILALIEAMVLGIKSLVYSAEVSTEEEEEKLSGRAIGGIVAGSIAFAVAVFFIAPLFLTRTLDSYIESSFGFSLVEGFIRVAIFLAYLKILTLIPSLRRIFAYHGAEHKAVNAYETGAPLELEAVRKFSTAHTRCGTSFLFVVMIIAIVVFALIGRPSLWQMVLSRVALVPVIAGLGYEVTQFGARHTGNSFIKAFLAPGLWLQRMTTREPDDSQLEISISALRRAVEIDQLEGED
ncbi:MAG: DUF1385 domain-containing protein [Chloroflexi bacterium]|nr:DUF1385 domain-containing protein [Chloroflexota bacterium]